MKVSGLVSHMKLPQLDDGGILFSVSFSRVFKTRLAGEKQVDQGTTVKDRDKSKGDLIDLERRFRPKIMVSRGGVF